jgi:hypothetical protein
MESRLRETRRKGARPVLFSTANEPLPFPQFEAAVGEPHVRVTDRRLIGVGLDPFGAVDLARSVEPIKPIRWHNPSPVSEGAGYHQSRQRYLTQVITTIALSLKFRVFYVA